MFCLLGWNANTCILNDKQHILFLLGKGKSDRALLGVALSIVEQQNERARSSLFVGLHCQLFNDLSPFQADGYSSLFAG